MGQTRCNIMIDWGDPPDPPFNIIYERAALLQREMMRSQIVWNHHLSQISGSSHSLWASPCNPPDTDRCLRPGKKVHTVFGVDTDCTSSTSTSAHVSGGL